MNPKISKLSDDNLISEIKNLVGDERNLTAEILNYLCEVQRRRLFAIYGYSSLFAFCVKYLGYTEPQTQRRIEAMRVMAELPEVEGKIREGTLSLSSVAQAQSYFRSQAKEDKPVGLEEKREVLLKLENKSKRECEIEIIKLTGEVPLPAEKSKTISVSHTQKTINFSNSVLEKLERIKALLSNKNPKMDQNELIDEMAEIVLDKIDPQRKQRRASSPGIVTALLKRDEGKCTYISPITNQRCNSNYFLEVDHVTPKALGGESKTDNLRLLCKAHNQRAAIEVFGLEKMDRYIN